MDHDGGEEKSYEEIDHRMVNPEYVARRAFDRIGREFNENTSLTQAKRIALEYGMLSAARFILGGDNRADLELRTTLFKESQEWLVAVQKTNQGDWSELLDKIDLVAMVVEDDMVGGSQKAAGAVYKLTAKIRDSLPSDR